MLCPACNEKSVVVDLSHNLDDAETYRLRRCTNCRHEFYTVESIVDCDNYLKRKWLKWHRAYKKGD